MTIKGIRSKEKLEAQIPDDVKTLIQGIAKRFRKEGMSYPFIRDYMRKQIIRETMDASDDVMLRAARLMGITYPSFFKAVKLWRQEMKSAFRGETKRYPGEDKNVGVG